MPKNKHVVKYVSIVLIVSIFCGTFLTVAFLKPDFFDGIVKSVTEITYNIFNYGKNNTNGDGDNLPHDNITDTTPHIGTWIHLDVPVDSCNREDTVPYTITSDFRNVAVTLQGKLLNFPMWDNIGTYTVDNTGKVVINLVHGNAGICNARVTASGIYSNLESIIVHGITIYQQKGTWHVGESYTAQMTSTYITWVIGVLQKNHTSDTWTFVSTVVTDANGIITYGTYVIVIPTAIPPPPGDVKDLIAVIDPDSSIGLDVLCLKYNGEEQPDGTFQIANSVIDSWVSSGRLDKSNILTINIVP